MPTAARQKYLAKQAAKKADILSETDRQCEYDKVMSQLTQISSHEVDKFEALMCEWVKDAKVRQGVIPIPVIRRALCYSLGISRSKTFVSLRSDEPEKYANSELVNIPQQQTIQSNSTESTSVEDEEIPELVSTTSETIPSATPATSSEATSAGIQATIQQAQKAKQKKQQVFSQSAPRGSRHASRPPPSMKPKAQSA